jgi:hypothetical protein
MKLGVCAAVVFVGLFGAASFSGAGSDDRVLVFRSLQPESASPALEKEIRVNAEDVPIEEVFTLSADQIGMPVRVAWRSLIDYGIEPGTRVTLRHTGMGFDRFLLALSDSLTTGMAPSLAARVEEGGVLVATELYFDRREVELVRYEVSRSSIHVVAGLVQKFVHPEAWEENGGDLARLEAVGSKLFVKAPRRFHGEVRWFIDEMQAWDDAQARQADEVNRLRQTIEKLEQQLKDRAPAGDVGEPGAPAARQIKIPEPLSPEKIASLGRQEAMREWTARKKAARAPGVDAPTRQRLLEESERCRERMQAAAEVAE